VSADLADHPVQPARGADHGQADGPSREGPLAQSIRSGDPGRRFVDRARQRGGAARGTRPPHFSAHVDFLKDEVFEICGALALGEGVLDRLGLHYEASQLAAVFAVVEGRLVERLPPYDGVAPGSCSNVSDRELTQ
jgi:hypothetical protein